MADRFNQTARYLLCRTLGHSWFPIDATESRYGDPMWLRCARCNTERHDEISMGSGELVHRKYVYIDSYREAFRNDFADAAPTRSDFRRMLLAEHLVRAHDQRSQHPSTRSNTNTGKVAG